MFGQTFEPTLAKLLCVFGQPFNVVHGQILKNYRHLGTLDVRIQKTLIKMYLGTSKEVPMGLVLT